MLKRLIKNKKGQNTAEYAILISLVVASIVAMQTYAQRALNARVKDASDYLTSGASLTIGSDGNTQQYEPYYQKSAYVSNVDTTETKRLSNGEVSMDLRDERTRTGEQETTFDANRTVY